MKQIFLIIGAPGSGKTTDAQLIAERNAMNMVHYSTGDLLRAEIASQSQRGKLIESFTSKGNLVPLEIVVQTILGAIEQAPRENILIDGYPRSVEQMQALEQALQTRQDVKIACVIEVVVSEEVACERVLGRARGDDDNAEVFKNRMNVYLEPLSAIQKFYKDKDLLIQVNGERSIEEIVSEIEQIIKAKI